MLCFRCRLSILSNEGQWQLVHVFKTSYSAMNYRPPMKGNDLVNFHI